MAETLDANTVKTYATVGLVFYGLATVLELLGILTLAWAISTPWQRTPDVPIVLMWASVPVVLSIVFTIWAYFTYKTINAGNYAEARTAALIVGIFGLGLGGFLGGLFFLLAYGKLGDLLRPTHVPGYAPIQAPSPPGTPSSASTRICVKCGRIADGDGHYCVYCGAQLPE